ncbi:hypothetical protein V8B97DRAFT_1931492 [Scleroderma yunnanense]
MDTTHTRRESHTRSREPKPLFTTEALALDRKKQPQPQPKKRKRPPPATPALSFDPKQNRIRSGRQDPSPTFTTSCPTPSDSSNGGSYEEPADFAFDPPQEPPYAFQPQVNDLASKRPRVFSGPTAPYPGASSTEMTANLAEYDSPLSCTSSSSPATSDQSPTRFSEHSACDGLNCYMQPSPEMFPSYAAYGSVPNETQLYARDSGVLSYPMPYHESNYAGATASTTAPSVGRSHWYPPP